MTEIQLNFDMDDVRAIYFESGNHKYFFGPDTKRQSALLVIIAYPFFANYALNIEDDGVFVLGSLFCAMFVYDFWKAAGPIIKWKKSVEAFLAVAQSVKELKVLYNDECIIHIQDKDEVKMGWTAIDRAVINHRMISLQASSSIMLPKNAMTIAEFEDLSKMILQKVKEVQKN